MLIRVQERTAMNLLDRYDVHWLTTYISHSRVHYSRKMAHVIRSLNTWAYLDVFRPITQTVSHAQATFRDGIKNDGHRWPMRVVLAPARYSNIRNHWRFTSTRLDFNSQTLARNTLVRLYLFLNDPYRTVFVITGNDRWVTVIIP